MLVKSNNAVDTEDRHTLVEMLGTQEQKILLEIELRFISAREYATTRTGSLDPDGTFYEQGRNASRGIVGQQSIAHGQCGMDITGVTPQFTQLPLGAHPFASLTLQAFASSEIDVKPVREIVAEPLTL